MNITAFASLSGSAFARLVRKRQALVAASAAVGAIMDADPCDRACRCDRRPLYDAAIKVESEAHVDLLSAEASWREYCDIRRAS